MFTLNRVKPPSLTGPIQYAVYQHERAPTTGQDHWQGFVIFTTPMRFNAVKAAIGSDAVHVEPARGSSEQCRAYCTKEETRVEGCHPIELGELPSSGGQRHDLEEYIQAVKAGVPWAQLLVDHATVTSSKLKWAREIFELHKPPLQFVPPEWRPWQTALLEWLEHSSDHTPVRWYYDLAGGAGKTTIARYLLSLGKTDYYRGGKTADLLYRCSMKPIQIVDLCREKQDFFRYDLLEQLYDGIVQSDKYECRCLQWPQDQYPKVLVFSNWLPEPTALSKYKIEVLTL